MNKIASRASRILQKLAETMESPTAWEERQKAQQTAYSFDPTKGTQPGIDPSKSSWDQKITPRSVMGNLYHGIHGTYDNMPSAARHSLQGFLPPGVTPEQHQKAWNRSQLRAGDTPQDRAAVNAATTAEHMVAGSGPGQRVEQALENAMSMIPSSQRDIIKTVPMDKAIDARQKSHEEAIMRKADILRKLIPSSLMRAGLPKGM